MIQPVIARKPKFVINPQRSPTLGFGLDTPVHFCGANCVCPLLLTDDIKKCTCHDCIIKVMQRMIGIKQKGENEDEEKSDTDGIRS